MNAKLLFLALLLTASGLRAQTTPGTNGLTHEEVMRRATSNSVPATGPNASASDAARNAAMEARIAQLRAQAATNRPPTARPSRSVPAVTAPPGPGTAAVPAAQPAAESSLSLPPELGNVVIRPPASADTIPDADRIMEKLSINWTAASLENVLEIYAEFVGRNLLRPATLPKAEIVLKQTTPLTKLEVVRMIEASLYLNQVSVVNVGEKFVTVVPTAEAFKIPGIINTNKFSSMSDLGTIATHVVQLKYTKPTEMMQILTPFASGTAASPIMPLDSSGMLVLRDNVANVKRMLEMIDKVDQVAQSEIISEVIPIKFAKAEEIASALSSVGGGSGGTVGTRPTSTGVTGATGGSRPGTIGSSNPYGGQSTMPGGAGATPTPSSNQTFGDRVRNLITKAGQSGDLTILGTTKIIADIRSNALLVFASRQDMEMIKDIIAKLDVVLAQVLVETVIMDVSIGSALDFGVSAIQPPASRGTFTGAGGMNANKFFDFQNASSTNALGQLLGSGLRYFGNFNDDIYVTVEAMAQDGKANVIQKPRIQTSHATPASIFIGETVPYISGTYYNYSGSPSSSYQQLKVGIGLDVTPFINTDGLVVMKIVETIDEVGESVIIDGNEVPKTTSRTLSAEVAVKDKETILLGGFIRNRDASSKSGVPLLKDIPLLGWLFRSSNSAKERKELIVLMRPTVLRTPEMAALQVDIEKERLPGVRAAERELDKVELQKARKEQKKTAAKPAAQTPAPVKFDEPAAFTPEEEQMLRDSQPVPQP
jgi:type II secretory pathway component GspD/PulD (secretin)